MADKGEDMFWKLFKILFGDVPAQWVRLILFGVVITLAAITVRDFKRDVQAEAIAVRNTLATGLAANEAWQNASKLERERLLKKANARLRRLYHHNGWEYEDIEP